MRGGAGAGRSLSHGPRYFLRSAPRGCAPKFFNILMTDIELRIVSL